MRTRILTATAFLFLTAVPSAAQGGGRGPDRGGWTGPDRPVPGTMLERQVEAALDRREQLGLAEGQVTELETLRSDIETTLAPIREEVRSLRSETRDRSGSRDEMRARMTEIRERHEALRARADTLRSPLQARFEQTVPPLQRQDLNRRVRVDGRRGAGAANRRPGSRGIQGSQGRRGRVVPMAGARRDGSGMRPFVRSFRGRAGLRPGGIR